jgi:hypothetical protein
MTTEAWRHRPRDEVNTFAHLQIPGHHQHDHAATPTSAELAEDAAFALLLISAGAIVDAILALLVLTY